MSAEDPLLLHHDYDGIQEHDNPAPPWLTRTFLGCIVFAAVYFAWFQVAHQAPTPQEDFKVAWADYQKLKKEAAARDVISVTEDVLAAAAKDPDTLAHGHAIFVEKCTGCHTDNGRGLVGPNLTDDFQLHGTTRLDIFTTITNGVVDKGMIAWGEQLPQHDILAVAAFVTTLRGTNVAGGKPPQGEKVGPFGP
jgi:cytochrome c oxidase cbb3-type subunit 3